MELKEELLKLWGSVNHRNDLGHETFSGAALECTENFAGHVVNLIKTLEAIFAPRVFFLRQLRVAFEVEHILLGGFLAPPRPLLLLLFVFFRLLLAEQVVVFPSQEEEGT